MGHPSATKNNPSAHEMWAGKKTALMAIVLAIELAQLTIIEIFVV
ncbi:hypothetical protein FTUN_3356 [Frigoriglobus tundricola]|uniref:Uncharacterized protein n=1 Tax=Frigoriglobus tundricola TaxID=2774151 RepID=A0A6M5YS43_9BACT|nr:hypothetical protein FTUN_3356 [Frigoriglobus tundricola]